MLEVDFPPKPRIGYGAFTGRFDEMPPGHTGKVVTGYGILDKPDRSTGLVRDYADDHNLAIYLRRAIKDWELECGTKAFNAMSHKERMLGLVGAKIRHAWIYSDEIGFDLQRVDADGVPQDYTVAIEYPRANIAVGLHTMDELRTIFNDLSYCGVSIDSIDGTLWTLSNDVQFHILPRFESEETYSPMVRCEGGNRLQLYRNYVSVLEKRDAEGTEPVNDTQPTEIESEAA